MAEKARVQAKTQGSRQKCPNSCKQNTSFHSSGSAADMILQLQRTAGNQAVQKLIKSGALQTKLRVGQPNDRYEQEADRAADQVMQMPDPVLHRKCDKCADDEKILQAKESAEQILETQDQDLPSIVDEVLRSPGQPLNPAIRAFMEQRFGYDFSKVRVHTGTTAEKSARALKARAYTVGSDIVFGTGELRPDSAEGKSLLAHEFVHVAQQNRVLVTVLPIGNRPKKTTSTHKKTHTVHQQAATSTKKGESPFNKQLSVPKKAVEPEKTSVSQAKKENESLTATDKGMPEETLAGSAVGKEISRAPTTPAQDPDFKKAKSQVRTEAKRQKKHDLASQKKKEAEDASAMTEDEQKDQSSKENNTKEMEQVGEERRKIGEKFDAQAFKKDLKNRIKGKGPRTERQAKDFAKKPPIEHFEEDFSKNVAEEQSKVTEPLEKRTDPNPKGGVIEKEGIEIPKPPYPLPPKPIDPKMVAPKAKTDQEISLQHESARISETMQKNRLSDEQLAESGEPSFLETLKVKQEAQQKIAEAPDVYRQRESTILQKAEAQAGGSLTTKLKSMNKVHHKISGDIFDSQGKTETETEKRQREIKKNIDDIYQATVNSVKAILKGMADKVKEDFANNLKQQTDIFNKNVRSRISDYYGFLRIDDEIFGPDNVVVLPDGNTRSMTPEEKFGIVKVESINPDVYEIFVDEKDKFLAAMDVALDDIANNVTTWLTLAVLQIQLGKIAIDNYKSTLNGEERKFADQLGEEVEIKFKNLESSIDDAREDLLQTLADDYSENVNQLEKTFNEINDELKKSWIDRAIELVETVGKTIYQLADLLSSILVRMANLVWDIIKHPIRFFETLVSGLKQGIARFIDNIGTHLQEAFWTWITGATPAKNIRLSANSGIGSLFDLVIQVLSLGPAELRMIVEKKLGKDFMQMVDKGMAFGEKVIEPVTILLTKGPLAFWGYIKETVGNIIQSSFDRIKESVFYAFVEKGLKWIAGFFIPGGGFVKVVKAIISAFQFVAENLENIRHFFDSVFDSMEAAIQGHTEGVASKIVTGLKTGVVLALDFLAKQLGLSKIVDSVQKIIQSLRRPIVNAIEWVLDKAKPFVTKIMKKGKELFEKGKAKVVGAGKAVVQVGVPEDPNERLRLAARASVSAAKRLTGRITQELLNPILAGIKVRYGLTTIQPYEKGGTWWVRLAINPEKDQRLDISVSKDDINKLRSSHDGLRSTVNNVTKIWKQGKTKRVLQTNIPTKDRLEGEKDKIEAMLEENEKDYKYFLDEPTKSSLEKLKKIYDDLKLRSDALYKELEDFLLSPEERAKEEERVRKELTGLFQYAEKVVTDSDVLKILNLDEYSQLKVEIEKDLKDLKSRIDADKKGVRTLDVLRQDLEVAHKLNRDAQRANNLKNIGKLVQEQIEIIDHIIFNTTKAGREDADVGDGSTEDAAKQEAVTGEPIKGAFHGPKCKDEARGLEKAINSLENFRKFVTDDVALQAEVDAAIKKAIERKKGLDLGWEIWKKSPHFKGA